MCNLSEGVEEDARADEIKELALKNFKAGRTIEEIARYLFMTVEQIKGLLGEQVVNV